MTIIRDFIYLDVEKLYSLYSQVFEGVADRIVQSYIDSLESKDAPKKAFLLRDSDVETRVIEVSRRTENKFLYDHMYNQLEGKLGDTIFDIVGASSDNYAQILKQAFSIRVTGSAEIEDFLRIRQFFDQFNLIGSALHYITSFDPIKAKATAAELADLKRRVESAKDRNEKTRAELALEAVTQKMQRDLRVEATIKGLAYDEKYLEYLCFLTDMFYPNRFDITILPDCTSGSITFRGILDKKWLRVEPSFLRSLYGGSAHNWTMVGQVTKLPAALTEAPDPSPGTALENLSLRDAYQNLIKQGYRVEDTFTVSQLRAEVSISPIAVYRESILPKPKS